MSILGAKIQALKEEEGSQTIFQRTQGPDGTGDRSEKIRHLQHLQDQHYDHRLKRSWQQHRSYIRRSFGGYY